MARLQPADELNLTPIMNLVTILIPFLLMAAQFVSLAVIDSSLPGLRSDPTPAPTTDEPAPITVAITRSGYELLGTTGEIGVEAAKIPCAASPCATPDAWETGVLAERLRVVKDGRPREETVILLPDPKVPYEVLVRTMDAAREHGGQALFPQVVIAGGAD